MIKYWDIPKFREIDDCYYHNIQLCSEESIKRRKVNKVISINIRK